MKHHSRTDRSLRRSPYFPRATAALRTCRQPSTVGYNSTIVPQYLTIHHTSKQSYAAAHFQKQHAAPHRKQQKYTQKVQQSSGPVTPLPIFRCHHAHTLELRVIFSRTAIFTTSVRRFYSCIPVIPPSPPGVLTHQPPQPNSQHRS